MAKIEAGCKLADFSFNTPFESDVKLSEKAKGAKKTILLFLRYYGCTLCQLDIREYANAYDRIKAKDAQLLVVLQSPASTINAQMKKEDLPFDIICDPDMGLYKEFELGVAASKEEMIRPEDMPKMGEKQFPGYFLLDSELNVLEAHRATSILDMPSVDEMIAKL